MFSPDPIEFFPIPVTGRVLEAIVLGRSGRVQCQGTSWFARLPDGQGSVAVLPGQPVKVLGRQGNTLLVLPD